MTTYISVLRGINVGGKRKILMADLKKLYLSLGFQNITTYIQSGNVIFDYPTSTDNENFENNIQEAILQLYGFDVPVIIRKSEELQQIFNSNPFIKTEDFDINKLHLTFLKKKPEKENIDGLALIDTSPGKYQIIDKDIYIYCNGRTIDSKLTNKLFENKLKVRATNRNWNTVTKLHELIINQ
ncbi:MAG: DUF1697 domain-containing protein [Bacteroidetes bacterium]|nr:DUF1697 domain-containing protein [Bacteroidota bacterium]